ncbi:divalent-cation tolerance protein CutA [Staphylothermus hellenicus]|uniref:CutA1 divalent ion tolerance protein n=1 Tax=Staphylothermus hellenicus (strain DSM 12710 / JCM 10830 / BK20S6-10-b1 / P8) TaxID=591019 RepID=D7DBA4_STAHD|nr:divalent-cation tolerance protein CutA [Staphylothermus hellenicus]ADI31451.1 CutA1 divalent ion tolerance protein [Staphylothermus hellenicus DSM 12710]
MIKGGWIIVFITASDPGEAERIAEGIVKEKLGACVNIVDKIHSIYWWQGKIEKGDESLLIIKTRGSAYVGFGRPT